MVELRIDPAFEAKAGRFSLAALDGRKTGEPGKLPDPRPPDGATLETLNNHPTARAYRDLLWRLGFDPTKTRPAAEALARRLLRTGGLAPIHPLVDAYMRASAATLVPVSLFDRDRLREPLTLTLARPGDVFHGIAREPQRLAGGEPVIVDADAAVISWYLYRDGQATSATAATRRAWVLACGAPGMPVEPLLACLDRMRELASTAGWSLERPRPVP